jgi:hypothetical protein
MSTSNSLQDREACTAAFSEINRITQTKNVFTGLLLLLLIGPPVVAMWLIYEVLVVKQKFTKLVQGFKRS